MSKSEMLDERSWEEFRDSGLFWFINRTLHLFGWAICMTLDNSGKVERCFPARCKFRGFDRESETEGFINVSQYLKDNIDTLVSESEVQK